MESGGWTSVVITVLGSGAAAAILNQIATGIAKSWETKRSARYLALQVALTLERFAFDCAHGIADQEMFNNSGGHAGNSHGKLPALQSYPAEADWTSLDTHFLERILHFPMELQISERDLDFQEEIDRENVHDACDVECGRCGVLAWHLAEELRSRYKFAKSTLNRTWNFVTTLEKEKVRGERIRNHALSS